MSCVLSIVVPTYNRAGLLHYLLTSICNDFIVWPGDLEVVVIDNASTDNTCDVVELFMAADRDIRLIRNPTNVGMDGNLAASFDAAHGRYLWQIGDDEVIYRGTTAYILNFCRTSDFGILHISNNGFSNGKQDEQASRHIPDRVVVEALDAKRLFRLANVYLTFISANVIDRRLVRTLEPSFDPYSKSGTHLPQLAWIFCALRATNRHYYIRKPLFGALSGNTGGYKLVQVFGIHLRSITDEFLTADLPNAGTMMSNAVLSRLLPGELMAQAARSGKGNAFESEDLVAVLDHAFGRMFFFKFAVRHLLSAQAWRRQLVFFLIRLFNRINRSAGYAFL